MSAPELIVAQRAARAAGDVVLRYYRDGVEMRGKQTYNLVSDADVEAERTIVELIRQSFPGHAVLAEEGHRAPSDAEHLWIVDPLDGTNNFAHHIPQFAVSIAYYRAGRPECGVVYQPMTDEWFVARRGCGAFHDGRAVQVSPSTRLDQALLGVGFFYDRDKIMEATLAAIGELFRQQIHGIRRFGAASLDLCWVGLGRFDGFFEFELAPWDFAAGRLFVEEAGGRVTTCAGTELPLTKSSVLATNGALHAAILDIVRRRLPPGSGGDPII
ncbi:MAG: inositol monophosphatase family protein [Pirellulales bacterium]